MSGTPAAEFDVTPDLVRGLLEEQHPDLADQPLRFADTGWDNVTYRLGEDLAVRLPRRALAADLLCNEQTWLSILAPRLPLAVPAPVRCGSPDLGYPWHWSVVPWFDGATASDAPPDSGEAPRLAAFLRALHQPAPVEAPVNRLRGCPLAHRAEAAAANILFLKNATAAISPAIEAAWDAGLQAPVASDACWLHGDLHARNVLVQGGAICAVIDWGDITSGDPATDLASIWALFDNAEARQAVLQGYGASEAETARAMGWAVQFGTVLLATGLVDNPRHAAMGQDMLRRIAVDQARG